MLRFGAKSAVGMSSGSSDVAAKCIRSSHYSAPGGGISSLRCFSASPIVSDSTREQREIEEENSAVDGMFKVISRLRGGKHSGNYSYVHCKLDSDIPLVGRSKILDGIGKSWSERAKSVRGEDRTLFPLPVIVGVPGS